MAARRVHQPLGPTLGLDHVRLHDLRHFTATQPGKAGTPVATISARLAHRAKATTLNIYSHAVLATDARAAETMTRLIGEPTNTLRSQTPAPPL